jgi:hypothetical protein
MVAAIPNFLTHVKCLMRVTKELLRLVTIKGRDLKHFNVRRHFF